MRLNWIKINSLASCRYRNSDNLFSRGIGLRSGIQRVENIYSQNVPLVFIGYIIFYPLKFWKCLDTRQGGAYYHGKAICKFNEACRMDTGVPCLRKISHTGTWPNYYTRAYKLRRYVGTGIKKLHWEMQPCCVISDTVEPIVFF